MSVQQFFTLGELCERWQCSHSHCLNLIRSGSLTAINIGTGGRSRYVVSAEALDDFESARTTRPAPKQKRRARVRQTGIIQFFK